MNIIAKRTLRDFWKRRGDAEHALKAWHQIAVKADWKSPHEITAAFPRADYVGGNRIVFNICGNKFRLVVKFNFAAKVGFIRFVGTHGEYGKINVKTV